MNKIIVRCGTKEDAELIADISRQTFYETFVDQNTKEDMDKFMNEQFTRAALIDEVGQTHNYFLLAEYDHKPAGYVCLKEGGFMTSLGSLNTLEIARIYTCKNMIGKGVGKALMQDSIDFAREKGKDIIYLGVWEKNERAIQFYQKWGFTKFGEQEFILGNDVQLDWLMKKTLNEKQPHA